MNICLFETALIDVFVSAYSLLREFYFIFLLLRPFNRFTRIMLMSTTDIFTRCVQYLFTSNDDI